MLVRTAARLADKVTVLVLASSVESIPLGLRVGWMRVVHAGAESTGKTTLAAELAGVIGARWVTEYGREHTALLLAAARAMASLDGKPVPGMEGVMWTTRDFVDIARRQNRLEDEEAR